MAVKVIVPNKHFKGVRAGVQFKNGEAIFADEKAGKELASFAGYAVEVLDQKEKPKAPAKPRATRKTKKAEE